MTGLSVVRARALIMSLEDVIAAPHVDREAFRAGGPIFASLRQDGILNVKLDSDHQAHLCGAEPAMFKPVTGGFGRMGFTTVNLDSVGEVELLSVLRLSHALSRQKLDKTKRRR